MCVCAILDTYNQKVIKDIAPTITTRVAESIGGGINASTILVCEELEKTTNLRDLYRTKYE